MNSYVTGGDERKESVRQHQLEVGGHVGNARPEVAKEEGGGVLWAAVSLLKVGTEGRKRRSKRKAIPGQCTFLFLKPEGFRNSGVAEEFALGRNLGKD